MLGRLNFASAGRICAVVFSFWLAVPALPQTAVTNGDILQRLDQLEKENHELLEQIKELRQTVEAANQQAKERSAQTAAQPTAAPASPAAAERTAEREEISEHRIEELAQTKVEASQRYPLRLTGIVLFNAFTNGAYNGGAQDPTVAAATSSARNSGATLRQTVLGLTYHGPRTFLGGTVSGSLYMDFFGGSADSLNHLVRLRLATIQLDWPNTTFAVGQDKPLVSRREPNSFAQVDVSPLTAAGNPWLWRPQARIEQRFHLSEKTTLTAEAGVFQTKETTSQSSYVASETEGTRPALETRLNVKHEFAEGRVLEVAPVFHTSTSHILGKSIPSRLYGVDWLVKPIPQLELTGMLFRGQNFANLGALGGTTVTPDYEVFAIHGSGGWAQLRYLATSKLSFDFYGGQQDDRNRDVAARGIGKNQYYAMNAMYLLAPNVVAAFEVGQARTMYLGLGDRLNNHYDLALAYLF